MEQLHGKMVQERTGLKIDTYFPASKITWLLQNNGSCPWGAGYELVFFAGDAMSGAGAVLPAAIPVGAQTEISVDLTAPTDAGPHMGQWPRAPPRPIMPPI